MIDKFDNELKNAREENKNKDCFDFTFDSISKQKQIVAQNFKYITNRSCTENEDDVLCLKKEDKQRELNNIRETNRSFDGVINGVGVNTKSF